MRLFDSAIRTPAFVAAGALALSLALPLGAAQAQDKTWVMKISTPTVNDVPDAFAKSFGAAVERDSGGRIKAEYYPASQLGSMPRTVEGTQFGAIQCDVMPPEFFVGVDERFEVMATPGLVDSLAHGQRVAADPAVRNLMLGLGANKGLHGVGLLMAEPSAIIAKNAIRQLGEFKGKKIRTFASQFQSTAWARLGATAVAMSLGDVLPALQQGAIDGAVSGIGPFTHMHFIDAAKYVTLTNQPGIFLVAEISKKWYDSLPQDLQQTIDKDAATASVAVNPFALNFRKGNEAMWTSAGGELIKLAPEDQASMMKTLSSVGADVSSKKPELAAAYKIVTEAAARTRQSPSQ
jgi:TRAP-type C4-dicarboxylate transport system substrate-binding protein